MSEEFKNFVTNVCQYFPPKNGNNRKTKTSGVKDNEFVLIRKQLLSKTFTKLDSVINKIRNDLFSPLMQSLFDFVSDNCLNNEMREKSFETKFKPNTGLIPTALLSIGMNSSEHKYICDLLVESIQDLTSFVVYLNSSECQAMDYVFKQICDTILTEEVIESAALNETQIKRQTFGSIFKIYEEFVINSNTATDFCPPIVFFFDEIENFSHSLITSLILIIKEYLQKIPFIIIMVKTNETISLQRLLPSNATDFLIIYPFHSFCGQKIMDRIIEDFFIESELAFKLGPNVLEFMTKIYENFDFSVKSIQNFIKCCIFLHFYSNELSFLCQTKSEIKSYVKNNDIKAMKSLRQSKLFDLSLDTKQFNKNLVKSVSNFISIHNQFVSNLKVLLILLNSDNYDISLTQLYIKFLDNSFDFKEVIQSLNKLTQNQWKCCLEKCLTEYSSDTTSQPLIDVLKLSQNSLIESLDRQLNEPEVVIERLDMSDVKNKLSNLKTRHQWKEIINPLNKPKVLTEFELWKKTMIESIEMAITEIPHPLTSPLSEIVFFDDLQSLKPNIFVVLRSDIQKSLSTPLIISDKNEEPKQILTDFHKFFTIYSESQTIFNMFDAFKEFETLLEPLDQKHKRNKTDGTNDENIVRYVNAISDFEYMGLIQSAKHKTEHLMRLIWF